MPFRLVEDAALGQFAFLVAVEVKPAGHAAGVMALGPHDEDRHQGKNAHGKDNDRDPFHGGFVVGRSELVFLPGRIEVGSWYAPPGVTVARKVAGKTICDKLRQRLSISLHAIIQILRTGQQQMDCCSPGLTQSFLHVCTPIL